MFVASDPGGNTFSDGSTDVTVTTAEPLQDTILLLRIIRNDHRGSCYAARTGVLAVRGTYVAVMPI